MTENHGVITLDRPLTVLLLEDNPNERKAISDYVETVNDVELVCETDSMEEALAHIEKDCPDAIILDIELHKGSGSGLVFLKKLREIRIPIFPYVLITTHCTGSVSYDMFRELGAEVIMAKIQKDYCAEMVIEFLRIMKSKIQCSVNNRIPFKFLSESPEQIKTRIAENVISEINRIGIKPKVLGRAYLIDAIMLFIEKPRGGISSVVASKYGKSVKSVEAAMQSAINTAWNTMCIDDLLNHYTAGVCSKTGVPTITEFIRYYADKVSKDGEL